jgi:N-acetylglucosamine-6-phosphate deacetylase
MDRAVSNLREFTGASLETAVRLASTNPATMLGAESAIAPGLPANFNLFDADGRLQATILEGVRV